MAPKKAATIVDPPSSRKKQKISHDHPVAEKPERLSVAEQRKRAAEWAEKQGFKHTPDKRKRAIETSDDEGADGRNVKASTVEEASPVPKEESVHEEAEEEPTVKPSRISVSTALKGTTRRTRRKADAIEVEPSVQGSITEAPRETIVFRELPAIAKPVIQPLKLIDETEHTTPDETEKSTEVVANNSGSDGSGNTASVESQSATSITTPPTTPPKTTSPNAVETQSFVASTTFTSGNAARPVHPDELSSANLNDFVRLMVFGGSLALIYNDFYIGLGATYVCVTFGLIRRLLMNLSKKRNH
jgi:hypothetical protein